MGCIKLVAVARLEAPLHSYLFDSIMPAKYPNFSSHTRKKKFKLFPIIVYRIFFTSSLRNQLYLLHRNNKHEQGLVVLFLVCFCFLLLKTGTQNWTLLSSDNSFSSCLMPFYYSAFSFTNPGFALIAFLIVFIHRS